MSSLTSPFKLFGIASLLLASCKTHATQVPLNLDVASTHSPTTMANIRQPNANSAFTLQDGPDIFSPKDLLQLPRPRAGVVNPAGDLVLVPVTQYSFDKKKTTKTINVFSLDSEIPPVTVSGLNAFWVGEKTFIRVTEDAGTQVLEAFNLEVSSGSLSISSPVKIGTLPENVEADNFVYSAAANVLVFSARVYEDYDLFTVKQQDDEYENRGTTAFVFDETFVRHWDTWRGPKKNRLFTVDFEHSSEKWVLGKDYYRPLLNTTHYTPVEPFGGTDDFAISSTHIVYTTKDPSVPAATHTRQNVYIVPLKGGEEPKHLTKGKQGATHSPVLSNKGDKVAWLELALDGYESDRAQIVVYDLAKDVRFNVAAKWDRSASEVAFSHDDTHLVFPAGDQGHVKIYTIELPETPSKDEQSDQIPYALTQAHTASSPQPLTNGRLVFTSSSLKSPNEVYLLSGLDSPDAPLSTRKITHFAKEGLKDKALEEAEEFWFEGGKEGLLVHGFIIKPKGWKEGSKKKWPAVLLIHGGPQSAWEDSWSTRWNPNVFAQQGYYTIFINPTGSTTYGQEFTDAITQNWGGRPFADLSNGWKYVLDTYPDIDPARTVAAGASWGGYAINWINGHEDEYKFGFKALVCHDGVFDTTYNGFSTDELFFFNHDFGGPPWKVKTAEKFNPSRFVSKWKTPQLLIHGGKDYRLPETESIGPFHALQQQGIPTRFLYFPDENHWVMKPENSLKWHYEVFRWFDEFVGEH